MAGTDLVTSARNKISEAAKHVPGDKMQLLNIAFGLYTAASGYREGVKEGQNPILAAALSGFTALAYTTMGFVPALLVTDGPKAAAGAVSGLYNRYQDHSMYIRKNLTPFSHSFQHSDQSIKAQQRGMQAFGRVQSYLGSEAGLLAQNYGRR